ncbi:MAG: hypothetical protein ABI311_05820 [Gemmatimonadaceae bacterium]
MTELPERPDEPVHSPELDEPRYGRRRDDVMSVTGEQRIVRRVQLAFAPLHKAAFGIATGIVIGGLVMFVTLLDMMLDPARQMPLSLLAQYFAAYSVSFVGTLIGGAWGFVVGFVAGWFAAFVRNAVMALWVVYFRARADWRRTSDFLDYI